MNLPNDTLLQGGKYRIIRFINSGGFGCTYEAEHTMLEKRVAIKEFFVKAFCNRDENTAHVTVGTQSQKPLVSKLRNKFIDEARAVCQLHHSHIINVSDIFEENGTAYFVMDYIDGSSLSDIINHDGPLPEARALKYIRQIASALQYVHDHNRLHLDIKPGNIMIDPDDNAILIDFGASKQYDEESGENTSTLMGKTPGYAPLEQMGNDVIKFTPATDIYALGATLYKLLTGITPLSASRLASGEELDPLPTIVSDSTALAITKAMTVNKMKRPQSMKAFLALLDETVSSPATEETTFPDKPTPRPNPTPHPQVSSQPSPNPTSKKNTRNRVLGWTIAVAAVIGIVVALNYSRRTQYDSSAQSSGTTSSTQSVSSVKRQSGSSKTFTANGVTFKMMKVESGTFNMSAISGQKESNVHQMTFSTYYIGETEVTQALWKAVMGSNPANFKGDNRPVETVSWDDCQTFIQKLNRITGENFRLPTEAEWVFAARGGNNSQGYQYPGSNNPKAVAWYYNNSDRQTHDVKTKSPNELGIYDMSGNVWERCQDRYEAYSSTSVTDPTGAASGFIHVNRGGGWDDIAEDCRPTFQDSFAPDDRSNDLGFRLAL